MKRNLLIIVALSLLLEPALLSQQKVWSLEECIRHAIDNNIQIKQQVLQTENQKNTLDLSKLKLLPTLNGQVSHNYSFNRSLNQTTYQYVNQNALNDQFYLGGSLNLFSGLQNYNTIKKNSYELQASEQDLQNIKDNIALNVALGYLQILLNKELVTAADEQLKITLQQIEKTKKLVDAGSSARGNLLLIQSQAAQEEVQLITYQNQLDISYLTLTQLLELQTPTGFEVVAPQISIDTNAVITGNIDEIFAVAKGTRPEVKSSELKLSASESDLKIAKGGRSPQLVMNHSFMTMYSNVNKKIISLSPLTYGGYPFGDQLNDNKNFGIGFSLNIPILNGWQVNKSIANSKIAIENSQYALEGTKKQLYKNIQQAYTDAVAALKKYSASMKAVISTEESFRYSEQKFNVGLVTPVDYNAAKTQLLQAQSDLAQSKYEFIFKTKVLDFYKGIPITLPQ
ncbi:MAG: TolC family protein [Bacteroidales bacterium]|jgi:outer membrane protein